MPLDDGRLRDDGILERRGWQCRKGAAECFQAPLNLGLQFFSLLERERSEAHDVAGFELPHLPALRLNDGCRTHEAAKTRSVWAEYYRHVPGKVDGAHRIRVVVNIGRMKSRFAAVFARPARLWTDQTHARAIRVVVDLPRRREDHVDVFRREKVRGAMRAVEYPDLPFAAVLRNGGGSQRAHLAWTARGLAQVQDVAGMEHAARLPSELAEDESGAASQIQRGLEAPCNGEVGSRTVVGSSKFEEGVPSHRHCPPLWHWPAIQLRSQIRARQRDRHVAGKSQRRASKGDLETGCIFFVADEAIGETKCKGIHGTRGWNADVPVAQPAGIVLNRGLRAGFQHIDATPAIWKVSQERSCDAARSKARMTDNLL